MYELLTGERPFRGNNYQQLCDDICNATPRSLRVIKQAVPECLEEICLRCLKRNPAERYATANDLVTDLRRWRDRPHALAARTAACLVLLIVLASAMFFADRHGFRG